MTEKKDKTEQGRLSFLEIIEHDWLEIAAAALLALATIMSAWSAYNASRWHAQSTEYYDKADTARVESSEKLTEMIQDKIIDVMVFTSYLNALTQEDSKTAEGYLVRMNPRLKVALDAWLKLDPMKNPGAPRSPFQMEEYKDEYQDASKKAATRANHYSTKAKTAMSNSNSYILLTVLFACVLFFAGISTKFTTTGMKVIMLALGLVLFVVSVVLFLVQPSL